MVRFLLVQSIAIGFLRISFINTMSFFSEHFVNEVVAFQMREVCHDNINHFIGAYIKPGRVIIISQLALRGSLEVTGF